MTSPLEQCRDATQAARDLLADMPIPDGYYSSSNEVIGLLDAALAAADAALAAQPEPDMRHPKIQALIGSRARREIELSIAEALLDDPAHEISGTDGDYWLPMHDKIVALQSDAPVAAQPLTDQDRMDAKRYRWLRDEDDGGEWACFDSSWLCKHDIYGEGPREMDAAIDMAMAAPKEPA